LIFRCRLVQLQKSDQMRTAAGPGCR